MKSSSESSSRTPFASTGPYGHRQRMRERVIAKGAKVLADYEVLEMLLFYGTPRGDTKPQAKSLINEFGSLAAVLSAPVAALQKTGVNTDCMAALKLSGLAARRLGEAEKRERPRLSNWEVLLAYFDTAQEGAVAGQLRVLFLDNRNRLLADEVIPSDDETRRARDTMAEATAILRRSLEVHATALILIRLCEKGVDPQAVVGADEPLARELARAGSCLSIALHDVFALRGGSWASLKQLGRL